MTDLVDGPLAGGRLSYLFVDVCDLDAMSAFYGGRLGLPTVFGSPGECAFFSLGGGPLLALYAGREDPIGPSSHVLVALDVPDLDEALAALRAHAVEIDEVRDVPGGRAAFFTDPEGNRLEIHQPG